MEDKVRYLTSGESHGKCLNVIIDGIPSNIPLSANKINEDLKKRQSGYGRGARMQIETDRVEIKSGIRFGKTTGAPICVEIINKDFENWKNVMSTDEIEMTETIEKEICEKAFTKLRPGHADFTGSVKYKSDDLRNILERSSARKTAVEVVVGSIAKQILNIFGIDCVSTVLQIGKVKTELQSTDYEKIKELSELSEVRCFDEKITEQMKSEIDKAKEEGNTLGGKIEVVYTNLPVGLGSYVQLDRAIDGKIAGAVMSIPAIKSVEIGAGVDAAELYGSQMHDEMFAENGKIYRKTNNSGGIEGGITNGEPLVVKAVMKPIPTMRKPLSTVDIKDYSQTQAHFERSDVCAVPACAIVVEAKIAIVLLNEFLNKYGGDSLEELKVHYEC